MLELTGAKADGWLPSLAYTSPDQFAESNKAIDAYRQFRTQRARIALVS